MFASTAALLITLLLYFLSPIFALVLLLFWIRIKIVETVARRWKGVSSILSFNSMADLVVRRTVIHVKVKVAGKLDMDELRQKFQLRIMSKLDSSGSPIYRNLQERIQWVFGFPFWTRDPNFNLENHIESYPSPMETVEGHDLDRVEKELLERSFDPLQQSPWQLTGINVNYNGTISTQIVFRIHHLLGDGHALFYLLTQLLDEKQVDLLKSSRVGLKVNPCTAIWAFLNAPFFLIKSVLKISSHPSSWSIKPSYSRVTAISNHISLADIKAAGKEANVGVTTVLMAGIARGLHLAPKELFTFGKSNFVPCLFTIRLPNNRKLHKLNNPVSPFSVLKVPLHIQDPRKCLQETNTVLSMAIKTGLFSSNFIPLMFGILDILRPPVQEFVPAWMFISNFPGPLSQVSAQGFAVEEIDFGLRIDGALTNLLFTVFSYNGSLRIRITADKCIVSSEEEAKGIISEIEHQIRLFKEFGSDSIV